jgi:hypothetical protein
MKKTHLAPYCIGLMLGNCFLPSLLGAATRWMRFYFNRQFKGIELPLVTEFSLAIPVWLYIFTALAILAIVGLFVRRISVSLLVHWLLAVCILECVILVCFALGILVAFCPYEAYPK